MSDVQVVSYHPRGLMTFREGNRKKMAKEKAALIAAWTARGYMLVNDTGIGSGGGQLTFVRGES